jgi:hypothetical protein
MPRLSRAVLFATLLVATPVARAADAVANFPNGTSLVVSFNVKQFLQAPLTRDNAAIRSTTEDMVKALDSFGIDSRTGLERIMLAVSNDWLMLLEGRFDADKVAARMKDKARERKDDIQIIDEGGAMVYQCRLPATGRNAKVSLPERFVMTVLDANTIALAVDRKALSEAIDKKAGRRKSDQKTRLTDLVARIDAKETVSIVYVPSADQAGPLGGIVGVSGGVTVSDGLATEIRIDAKDADATKLAADTVREAIAKVRDILPGLAAMQLGLDNAGKDAVREMVDSFKVTTSQNTVVVSGSISKELIEKTWKKSP